MAGWLAALGCPLLANIYLNPLDQLMSQHGHEMVRYPDDMVILCPSAEAAAVLQTLREWSVQAGLTLHPEKAKIVNMGQPQAYFDFLGYRFWRGKTSGKTVKTQVWISICVYVLAAIIRKELRLQSKAANSCNQLMLWN